MDDNRAFVTGSYAYGIPHLDSDLDLVILVSEEDLDLLVDCVETQPVCWRNEERHFEIPPTAANEFDSVSVRYGMLNLVATSNAAVYKAWRDGTAYLKTQRPVSRDEACEYLRKLRDKARARCDS